MEFASYSTFRIFVYVTASAIDFMPTLIVPTLAAAQKIDKLDSQPQLAATWPNDRFGSQGGQSMNANGE